MEKDKKISKIKERVLYISDYYGISREKFFENLGFSYANFKGTQKNTSLNSDALATILSKYPEVNSNWLITGEGEMLKANPLEMDINRGVPYWNLPVSAGRSIIDIIGKTNPDGYISGLPGADMAESILPVIGTSMEPEILNGAIVGVRKMNNWETLNTERIYLIITRDDRMVKRIEYDLEKEDILWCVSPNYPKFKIYKSDIIDIERVCFVYNPK